MMKSSRGVKVFALIGAIALLSLGLACATTSLLPTVDDKVAAERTGVSPIERVSSVANDFRAELTTEGSSIITGQPAALILNIKDGNGESVSDMQIVHEKPIHLILVSDNLAEFNHLHPEAQSDGSYRVNFTFPHGGAYRLYADFTPANASQVVEQYKLTVSGDSVARVALTEDKSFTKSVDGLRVTMQPSHALRASEALLLEFTVADEATGKPVTDLQPYLGSLAHFVLIPEDGSEYLHVHPMEGGGGEQNHEGMMGKMHAHMDSGPSAKSASQVTVSAHATFPDAGLYKLWAQFQRAGKVITVPFVLRVNADGTARFKNR